MPISGVWGDLLGNDAFSKFGFKLWWEKAHAICNTLYVVLIFTFGVFSIRKEPSCVPTTENASIVEVGGYISDFCVTKAPSYANIAFICFYVICAALIVEILSIAIVRDTLRLPMRLFSNAEKEHGKLKLSLEDTKVLTVEPNCSEKISRNSSASLVREIFLQLRKCTKKITPSLFVFREIVIVAILVSCAVYISVQVAAAMRSRDNPIFDCKFEEAENVFWNINGTLNFVCTHPWTERELTIVYIYIMILASHIYCRLCGMYDVVNFYIKGKRTEGCRAKGDVLFLENLWAHGRTEDQREFGRFVHFLYSNECSEAMEKNIKLVGARADPQFAEMAAAITNLALELVNFKPNLQGLIDNKRWDWIVALLEKFPDSCDDLSPLGEVDLTTLDSESSGEDSEISRRGVEGRSLLFYALNREPGCVTFQMRAASIILVRTKHQKRVVCYNGGRVAAKEFVEMQHASEPTYPDRIKDNLLGLIEAET